MVGTKTYYIKRTKEGYQLLIPEENPMDVGHWKEKFSEHFFPDFYYRLLSDIFLEIGEDDRIFCSDVSEITIAERACIYHVCKLYKAVNNIKRTLDTVLEEPESLHDLFTAKVLGIMHVRN